MKKATVELRRMLKAVHRDAPDLEKVGRFRCRKRLCDGTVVVIDIKRPPLKEKSK